MEILSNINTRCKYDPIIQHMDGFAPWLVGGYYLLEQIPRVILGRNLMKVLLYFIKSYYFFFFTILSLLIDCGEKTWSLQIIHFYFEEDFFFFTIVLHMGFSYRDKKSLGAENETIPFRILLHGT